MSIQPDDDEPSLLGEIGQSAVSGAASMLRWTLAGALIGGLALGGAGGYYFGLQGFALGAAVGAAIGVLAAWWIMSEI